MRAILCSKLLVRVSSYDRFAILRTARMLKLLPPSRFQSIKSACVLCRIGRLLWIEFVFSYAVHSHMYRTLHFLLDLKGNASIILNMVTHSRICPKRLIFKDITREGCPFCRLAKRETKTSNSCNAPAANSLLVAVLSEDSRS